MSFLNLAASSAHFLVLDAINRGASVSNKVSCFGIFNYEFEFDITLIIIIFIAAG